MVSHKNPHSEIPLPEKLAILTSHICETHGLLEVEIEELEEFNSGNYGIGLIRELHEISGILDCAHERMHRMMDAHFGEDDEEPKDDDCKN